VAGVLLLAALTGCERDDDAKVYHVAKDEAPPSQAAPDSTPTPAPDAAPAPAMPQPDMSAPPPTADTTPAPPPLTYHVPAGWKEKPPSDMRVASFSATGPNGDSADISVIPLGIVGRDMELVNMWRSQVQLPPTNDPDAIKQAQTVPIGSDQGRLFEYVSEQPMLGPARQRIMIATVTRGTMSWFFKIGGQDAFITAQKPNFLAFLKSVSFSETASSLPPSSPVPPTEGAPSIWTVPPDWQPTPPAQFLLAEFAIAGANGAKAEVNVAELDDDGGGTLPNVNRWRGQIGLAPVGESDLPQLAQSIDVPGGKATVVDLTGTDAKTSASTRLIGVIVTQNGQTWFYKLMGDKPVVAQQKDAFTKFIQSANYANAR